MNDPIIFISRNRVKDGMLANFIKHYQNSVPRTEAEKSGTFVQLAYISDDASLIDIIRLFPNADAFDLQLQGADDRSKITYQFIEPTSVEIYGSPNEFAIEMMKKIAGSGINVSISPRFIGGFIRPQSGRVHLSCGRGKL
jgi:hypothetical protein